MNRYEKMSARLDELYKAGQDNSPEANKLFEEMKWVCRCGGDASEQYDGHGIYCGRMCEECFGKKYRKDIRTPYYDYLDAGEYLEPDDY